VQENIFDLADFFAFLVVELGVVHHAQADQLFLPVLPVNPKAV